MADKPYVIIVDDDDAIRDSLSILLEPEGFEVRTHASGTDFLDAYDPTGVRCLLLDVRLPDITGLELLEILTSRGDNIPVIIITGFGDVPMAVKALKAGAVDFIEKPFKRDVILDCVKRTLTRFGQPHSPQSAGRGDRYAFDRLAPREREVLELLVIGKPNKVIAFELGISPRTVEAHRARVMRKMQANSLSHLVRMAMTAGLEPRED